MAGGLIVVGVMGANSFLTCGRSGVYGVSERSRSIRAAHDSQMIAREEGWMRCFRSVLSYLGEGTLGEDAVD